MKIGIISDIHSNLEALKTIINKFNEENVDLILCAGDLIGLGPHPNEVVEFVSNLDNFICVLGNHDRYLLEGLPEFFPNKENMSKEEKEHHEFIHNLLSDKSKQYLKSLPLIKEIKVKEHSLILLHYYMNENNEYKNYKHNPSFKELEEMFSKYNANIIVYGHNHNRSVLNEFDKYFINPGSLGCPSKDKNIARALILKINEKISFNFIDYEYNVYNVLKDIEKLNFPSKDEILKIFYGV